MNIKILTFVFLFGISLNSFSKPTMDKNPVKTYQIHFSDNSSFGVYSFYLNVKIDQKDNSFIAYSNPEPYSDIVKKQLGFFKGLLFSLKSKYKKTALWTEGKIVGDSLEGRVNSAIGFLNSSTLKFVRVSPKKIKGFLMLKKGKVSFVGDLKEKIRPIENYKKISQKIIQLTTTNFFNPNIFNSKKWTDFTKSIKKAGNTSHDDLDFLLSFYFVLRNAPVSHFSIEKISNSGKAENINNEAKNKSQNIEYKIVEDSSYASIKFYSFSLSDTLLQKEFFKKCKDNNVHNLVIDLRYCPGGDFSSIQFAENFMPQKSITVGYFLGRKYYLKHPSSEIDTSALQGANLVIGKSVPEFYKRIAKLGVLKGVATGKNYYHFKKIVVLTSSMTASSAEPFTWLLKKLDIPNTSIKIIGEKTAGAMLSAKPFELSNSWQLRLPIANFITGDFVSLEGKGVATDIETPSDKAMEKALGLIGG